MLLLARRYISIQDPYTTQDAAAACMRALNHAHGHRFPYNGVAEVPHRQVGAKKNRQEVCRCRVHPNDQRFPAGTLGILSRDFVLATSSLSVKCFLRHALLLQLRSNARLRSLLNA